MADDEILKIVEDKKENFCLIFKLHEKTYAIDIANVVEIINITALDVPQKLPKHIIGILTYNNMTLNVIDLRSILDLPISPYSIDSQIIIVKTEESIYGIMADSVVDVYTLKMENMTPLPYHSEENLIKFLYRCNDDFASVLDLVSVENIIKKTQFEQNNADVEKLLPLEANNQLILKDRQQELINKFENNIDNVYYDTEQYIIFDLCHSLYAIPIKYVKELVKFKNISLIKLPKIYDYIEGVFNLRGDFISLINLKKFVNISSLYEDDKKPKDSMLIVLNAEGFKLSVLVDNIVNIVIIAQKEIVNKLDEAIESKYLIGEIYINNKVISLISIEKFLSDERLYIND